jgi:hypothetical protein
MFRSIMALASSNADVDGQSVLASAVTLNRVLAGNVDKRGFVSNEHRYLVVAQNARPDADIPASPGHT